MALKDRLASAMAGPPLVSQAALARACGVKQPSVNDWLSGKTKTIRGGTLLAVARFLKVSPDWLATGKGHREVQASEPLGLAHHFVLTDGQPLTPEVIAEAEYWVRFEEGSGVRFQPVRRAERLLAFCAEVAAHGGRLDAARAAELVAARIEPQGEEQNGAEKERRGRRR